MDLLWTALGICVIVGFVFYVLAAYWQRLIQSQSWSIRRLNDRLQALEEVEDPEFRRRLGESAPSPLEQVFTFSLRLDDRFWKESLGASAEEMDYVKTYGKFLGSVKIERWRSHSVATVTEVLPQRQSASWQTRQLDIYSVGAPEKHDAVTLWEMPLAACGRPATEAAPGVELRLRENTLELCARHGRFSSRQENGGSPGPPEIIFLAVPLDADQLGTYRDASGAQGAEESGAGAPAGNTWLDHFAHADDVRGLDWHLSIRDLDRKDIWERWKTLETVEARRITE